jgi:hypothetical protein
VTSYGRDLAGVFDLDPLMRELEDDDRQILIEATLRRITTDTGQLIDDPTYGKDVRRELSRDLTDDQLAMLAPEYAVEILRDERVLYAEVVFEVSPLETSGARRLRMQIRMQDAAGPFRLTLDVSAVNVQLLEVA